MQDMLNNIEQNRQAELEAAKNFYSGSGAAEEEVAVSAPTDIYNAYNMARIEESKRVRPNGSSALAAAATRAVVDGDGAEGLAHAYKRAKDDIELFKKRGEVERAELAKRQYMEENFLPAVETVVRFTSPDEVLNCKEALGILDAYVMGVGKADGYTRAYIRSAYDKLLGKDLNSRFNNSDPTVRENVCKIKMLANNDNVRLAVGVAQQIKRQIDNGEHIANDEDYSLIGRVAAYGD